MNEIREYVDLFGISRFGRWFSGLNSQAAAKVTTAIVRLSQGNFSNVKGVGQGVFEYRINFGPGYRVYFSKDGDDFILLLAGGSKKHQVRDVATAKDCWLEYKARKKG